jgi:hypothetical protein
MSASSSPQSTSLKSQRSSSTSSALVIWPPWLVTNWKEKRNIISAYNEHCLNVITVNVLELNQFYQFQITLLYLICAFSSFGRCYHSMNAISYGLTQSDHIKRQLSVTNIKLI